MRTGACATKGTLGTNFVERNSQIASEHASFFLSLCWSITQCCSTRSARLCCILWCWSKASAALTKGAGIDHQDGAHPRREPDSGSSRAVGCCVTLRGVSWAATGVGMLGMKRRARRSSAAPSMRRDVAPSALPAAGTSESSKRAFSRASARTSAKASELSTKPLRRRVAPFAVASGGEARTAAAADGAASSQGRESGGDRDGTDNRLFAVGRAVSAPFVRMLAFRCDADRWLRTV